MFNISSQRASIAYWDFGKKGCLSISLSKFLISVFSKLKGINLGSLFSLKVEFLKLIFFILSASNLNKSTIPVNKSFSLLNLLFSFIIVPFSAIIMWPLNNKSVVDSWTPAEE